MPSHDDSRFFKIWTALAALTITMFFTGLAISIADAHIGDIILRIAIIPTVLFLLLSVAGIFAGKGT